MNIINISAFISGSDSIFHSVNTMQPWEITSGLAAIILNKISTLGSDYSIRDGIAIHKTATVEDGVILKPPAIICTGCFIGANAYLRNAVFLGEGSSVGPGCEVKTSVIFPHTEIAHLNFIGNSIIGSHCNFEAGSITANYFNERSDKTIYVFYKSDRIKTGAEKFGSLVGDNCKIGANAVLSPGTLLVPGTVIKRLELVEQGNEK